MMHYILYFMVFRGQILIAIKTEISESIDTAPSEVEVEQTQTINEASNDFSLHLTLLSHLQAVYNKNEDFFLFGSVLEATMIDKK